MDHALTCATDSEKAGQWGFSGYTLKASSDECLANHVSFFFVFCSLAPFVAIFDFFFDDLVKCLYILLGHGLKKVT